MTENCPSCQSTLTVEGCVGGRNLIGMVGNPFWPAFRPQGHGAFDNVDIEKPFRACSECGLVWARLQASELSDSLAKT